MYAQNFCRRTSVFFDHDQSELTDPAKRKLDSLANVMKGKEYIVELYGHTDTTGNYNYNIKLANERMRAIEAYLRPKCTAKLTFTENNLPESNYRIARDEDRNLAYNRRVDIFFIPTSEGKVQMSGNNKGSIEAPPGLFGPCGICNSTPQVSTFLTREETDRANIELETTEGDSLITAGMIMLNYKPCTGQTTKLPDIKFKMCPGQPDPGMSLWEADTVDSKIKWVASKDSLSFDFTCGCYVFKGKPRKVYNVDKRFASGPPPPPDTFCRIIPSLYFAYEQFITTDAKNLMRYNAVRDSVAIGRDEKKLTAHAVGKVGEDYYLLTAPVDSLPSAQHKESDKIVKTFSLPPNAYSKLEFSDTLLKVRCGKTAKPGQFGVYLPEYKQFIPFDSTDGKYYYGHKPKAEFQYAYKKGKRLTALKNTPVKSKYSASENTERIKFRKKLRRKFRSVNKYFEAP